MTTTSQTTGMRRRGHMTGWLMFWRGLRAQPLAILLSLCSVWSGGVLAVEAAAPGAVIGVLSALAGATALQLGHEVSAIFGASTPDPFAAGAGGTLLLLALVAGAMVGAVGGAASVLAVSLAADNIVGLLVDGSIVTLIIFAISYGLERQMLTWRGYRQPGLREQARLLPLLDDAARALGVEPTAAPPLLIRDSAVPSAHTYMRAVVLSSALLGTLDDTALAGVLAHELAHWRAGDPAGYRLVWAAALPLALVQMVLVWLGQHAKSALVAMPAWVVFWPVAITVRLVLAPVYARRSRRREYAADAAAAAAGPAYQEGLRRALTALKDFEAPITSWEMALVRSHPPTALRIDRLLPDAERQSLEQLIASRGQQP